LRALVAVATAVGPLLAGAGLGAFDVQLAPTPRGQRQVVFGEADRFLGSQSGVVQAAEEGDQASAATLFADGVEQRAGLDRVGDPAPVDPVVLGGVHFSAGIGFLSSSSSSTAYSRAAWRILRRRLVTLDAAGVPSSVTVRPSRTCRSRVSAQPPRRARLRELAAPRGSKKRACGLPSIPAHHGL
jgi:hypothetical protein